MLKRATCDKEISQLDNLQVRISYLIESYVGKMALTELKWHWVSGDLVRDVTESSIRTWYSLRPWWVQNPTLSMVNRGMGVPLRMLCSSIRGKFILKSQDPNWSTSRVLTFFDGSRELGRLFGGNDERGSQLSTDFLSLDTSSSAASAVPPEKMPLAQ